MGITYEGKHHRFTASVEVGQGGMARVYQGAFVDDPDKAVAIKTPKENLPDIERGLFLGEAEAASRVADRRVVRVVDWGEVPVPFIAFEFESGRTLDKEIGRRQAGGGPWLEPQLIAIFCDLVAAMKAVNEHVIHRDLKPANIFYQDGDIKVGDFGLAKYVGEATRSRSFKGWGTLAYMAPETIKSVSVDWRSDQYSLGILMYEMAALQRPFVGSQEELERHHLYTRPRRLNEFASVSVRLGSTIARMLEKRREQRFQSWDELLAQLGAGSSQLPASEDPLAAVAAQQLEVARARALGMERAHDEARARLDERCALLSYWSAELFGLIRKRLDGLRVGANPIDIEETPAATVQARRRCIKADFFNSELTVCIEVVPVGEGDNIQAWGTMVVRTNRCLWGCNLALLANEEPYGSWMLVKMERHPLYRDHLSYQDNQGGLYEELDQGRILAMNWQAVAYRRRNKGAVSGAVYNESPLDLPTTLDECLTVFVKDAAAEDPI